jgi:hypothetical protein
MFDAATGCLAQALAGRAPVADLAAIDRDVIWTAADRHGVTPLLAERLSECAALPPALASRVRQLVQQYVATDLLQETALRECVDALAAAGEVALLIKGALLAYTHYPRPDLRPRIDTDLLIAVARRPAVDTILTRLGYEADVRASSDFVLYQQTYVKPLPDGEAHVIDVHWRLSNPEVFRSVLTFDEMNAASIAVPALGNAARGLSDVHALLVACVHRVAHHRDDERLIWLYDIHLLASRLNAEEWAEVASLAADRRVMAVCASGLQRASRHFGTAIPDTFTDHAGGDDEVTAKYLEPHRAQVNAVVDDLRSLPTWADRVRLMREYAFPPRRYMREIYAPASASPLPWLYVRRMVFGARRWLAH